MQTIKLVEWALIKLMYLHESECIVSGGLFSIEAIVIGESCVYNYHFTVLDLK